MLTGHPVTWIFIDEFGQSIIQHTVLSACYVLAAFSVLGVQVRSKPHWLLPGSFPNPCWRQVPKLPRDVTWGVPNIPAPPPQSMLRSHPDTSIALCVSPALHSTPSRRTVIKNMDNKCWQGSGKLEPSCIAGGNTNWDGHLGNSLKITQKVKRRVIL